LLDVELPKVQNTRVDLLGETNEARLVHLELQSGNDTTMPLRMAEYCLSVFRLFGKFPRQVLLYVGEAPLRMNRSEPVADPGRVATLGRSGGRGGAKDANTQ
jgi:hypothetical protein